MQVDVVHAERAGRARDDTARAVIAARLHEGAVAHRGGQAVEVVVAVVLDDVAAHGRPLTVRLHDPHAGVLVARAVAVLVVAQPVPFGAQHAAVGRGRVDQRLAVHLVVGEVAVGLFCLLHLAGLDTQAAVVQLGGDVGAVAGLVVVDGDVRVGVGHPAQAAQRVVRHLVVLVGDAALRRGLAHVAACQVIGVGRDLAHGRIVDAKELAGTVVRKLESDPEL